MPFLTTILPPLRAALALIHLLFPVKAVRLSYLPPLMVYLAAGISGLTAIVGAFFVKEHLGLSAASLAGLAFWAGIPWTLKMPLGHLVDLIWRWKSALVYLGALLIAASFIIVYGLITGPELMTKMMGMEAWYVVSVLLAPVGYVLQDVVADAMTVEAVPTLDEQGRAFSEAETKSMHTTMQTLGRVAVIFGSLLVALVNIGLFTGVEQMTQADKTAAYATIYLRALIIPLTSVAGVAFGDWLLHRRKRVSRDLGPPNDNGRAKVNWWIFAGTGAFVLATLAAGLVEFAYSQEMVLVVSLAIIAFLIHRLLGELEPDARLALVGTAIIIFVFRAVPLPGPGVTWWEIDALGFDQQFLSVLTLITSVLALLTMLLLRPVLARHSIAHIVLLLALAAGLLSLPNIGLFYGMHHWTMAQTGEVVDARFIAILDTALESPLSQVAMIPLLAWIARNAPGHLKATFFAVMASFTNLALSASALGTKYLNQIFTITREVRDGPTGSVIVPANYSEVGPLLIVVAVIAVLAPFFTVFLIQHSRLRTQA